MKKISRRRFMNGLAGMLAGAATGSALGFFLAGCRARDSDNYESRMRAVENDPQFNPYFKEKLKEIRSFYASIKPYELTEEQRQTIIKFNKNSSKYSRAIEESPWIEKDRLTIRDKIYVVTIDEAAEAAARSFIP